MFANPILESEKDVGREKDERRRRIPQLYCARKEGGMMTVNPHVAGLYTDTTEKSRQS